MTVNNRQLSAKDRERQRERTMEAEKKKHSRQLLVSDPTKTIGKLKRPRVNKNGTKKSLLDSARTKKPIVRRVQPPTVTKRQRPTPPIGSPSSPDRGLSKPASSLGATKPRPSVNHTTSRPIKPSITSLPSRTTPSPAVSRDPSPADISPSSTIDNPSKSVEDLRIAVMHILALGKTSLTTMRERLRDFEYEKKIEILKKVGKYTGEGYILKEKYWDEIDPCWPHYASEEQDAVEEAKEKVFIDIRTRDIIGRMRSPPPEQKAMSEAFARAWARWKNRKFLPRPEITNDDMDDEYRHFYNKWLPHYKAIVAQVDILINYFEQYAEVYKTLEYRFEYEAADKHIAEIARQWAERKDQASVLMEAMHRELSDAKKKIHKWAEKAESDSKT